jgi:hypothetical protein
MNLFDDITRAITEDSQDDLDWDIFEYQPTVRYMSKAIPITPIGHPDFIYYPSADTDVTRTWRRFGWTPVQREGVQ